MRNIFEYIKNNLFYNEELKKFIKETINWIVIGLISSVVFIVIIIVFSSVDSSKNPKESKKVKPNKTIVKEKIVYKTIYKKITIHDTVTANVSVKSDFIFAEGAVIGKSFKIEDKYTYNPDYPSDIYSGYFTLIKTFAGTKYFMWSAIPLDSEIKTFKGWYVQVEEFGCYGLDNNTKYIKVLFPITKRK